MLLVSAKHILSKFQDLIALILIRAFISTGLKFGEVNEGIEFTERTFCFLWKSHIVIIAALFLR